MSSLYGGGLIVPPGGGGGGGAVSNPVTTTQGGLGANNGAANGIPQFTAGAATVGSLPLTSSLLTGVGNVANGFTGANLNGTGGTGQLVKQTSVGGVLSVANLNPTDLVQLYQQTTPDLSQTGQFDDFMGEPPTTPSLTAGAWGPIGFRSARKSGTEAVSVLETTGRPGVHVLPSLAASPSGVLYLSSASNFFAAQAFTCICTWTFQIPTFATAGEDGLFWVGFSDVFAFNELTTGNTVAIGVDRVTDASHFTTLTVSAGTVKTRAATTTTAAAGTWYTAKLVLNTSGTSQFFIAPVGGAFTEVSTSPTSAANTPTTKMSLWAETSKTAGTVTILNTYLDACSYLITGLSR